MSTINSIGSNKPIEVAFGGTGDATLTLNGVLYGNSTSPVGITAAGTTGQILTATTGSAPSWASPAASSITITGNSGGGLTGNSFTFTGGTTGLTFAGAGTTETLGGTLAIANGGTNATSMTNTDGVVYYDGTRLVTTAVGTAAYVLTSNGAGMAPTFQAASSGGITTLNGNSGSATGSTVTITTPAAFADGRAAFSGAGSTVTLNFSDSGANLCLGADAGAALGAGGTQNVALGRFALQTETTRNNNMALGAYALNAVNGGTGGNCAVGTATLFQITSGSLNVGIGYFAGSNYTGAESYNVLFNAPGTVGESNTLRIGAGTGTGSQQLNAAYISGIQGVGIVGTAVLVSASDQLGIAVSSRRFKENVQPLNDSKVLDLQPVSFNYKQSGDKSIGLIAEDVFELIPDLVVNDKDGLPLTVKYQDLPVYLLAEIKKLRAEVNALKGV